MSVLEPVFTKPAFIIFIPLVAGWILCPVSKAAYRRVVGGDPVVVERKFDAGPPPARVFARLRIVRRIAVANARLAAG
jgi:hypothetical protein